MVVGLGTGPASAQYGGGGIEVFADPVRVPIDQTFNVFVRGCAPFSTVVITIDGVDAILATGPASSGGFFAVDDLPLPAGLVAGTDQDVRGTCGTETDTALITLVCPSGDDPVDGSCVDGSAGIVGGPGPTTTLPAGSGTSTGGPTGGLAITGATFVQWALQFGVTVIGLGMMLLVVARRRRDMHMAEHYA